MGQNDLALNAPRLGFEAQRDVGQTRIATSIAFGEFKGAAYGGAPVFDNVSTRAARPEIELFAHGSLLRNVDFNAQVIDGERARSGFPRARPSTILTHAWVSVSKPPSSRSGWISRRNSGLGATMMPTAPATRSTRAAATRA